MQGESLFTADVEFELCKLLFVIGSGSDTLKGCVPAMCLFAQDCPLQGPPHLTYLSATSTRQLLSYVPGVRPRRWWGPYLANCNPSHLGNLVTLLQHHVKTEYQQTQF